MTPLTRLVTDRQKNLGLTRSDVARRLGWTNLNRGLRHLDTFLATGQAPSPLLKGLPDALGLAAADLDAAVATTRQQIADAAEAAARARFRPHVEVLARRTDGEHISAFVQMLDYDSKILSLADSFDLRTAAQQVQLAARTVRRHFRKTGGELRVWGTITGYRLQRTFDHAVILNTDGTVREGFNRDGAPPAPEIRIKGKPVPVGLFR